MKNLDKILYYAEKSVVFPLSPLFDRTKQTLRPVVHSILRRIFRIINRSHTLVLTDDELNEFQVRTVSCALLAPLFRLHDEQPGDQQSEEHAPKARRFCLHRRAIRQHHRRGLYLPHATVRDEGPHGDGLAGPPQIQVGSTHLYDVATTTHSSYWRELPISR